VYVPVTDKTPPNPYLSHIKERDIKTPDGKALTLMNPAYMLRQTMETYKSLYGVRGHITSLKHFRPETAPDQWEKSALQEFERGVKEIHAVAEMNGKPYYRYMEPMIVKTGCLKCHGHQGYKEGDVRGGQRFRADGAVSCNPASANVNICAFAWFALVTEFYRACLGKS
jgi:hypothetical protein